MTREGGAGASAEAPADPVTSEYPLNVASNAADNPVRLLLPDEPPPLTADAARALFRLLLNVHRQRNGGLDV